MEKPLKAAIICLSLLTTTCFADTLVLSTKLKIEYPAPTLISHGLTNLVAKYNNDRSFMHVVVDTKNIYQQIDLTGMERTYIKSIFDEKERSKLTKELCALSKEQAGHFGVTKDNVQRLKVGNSKVIAVHNNKNREGQIYIFGKVSVHQIYTYGTKQEHDQLLNGIKER